MTTLPAPVRTAAPDLARAVMLLLIALANVHLFVAGAPGVRGYPAPVATADRWVTAVQMALVDGRAYPLFAALFGYGLVRFAARRPDGTTRRALVLVAVGALHGVLLFSGDIIAAYGLVGLVLGATAVTSSPRALLVGAGSIALLAVLSGVGQASVSVPLASLRTPSYLASLGLRISEWVPTALYSALVVAPAVLFGAWVARAGVLDDPARSRRLLLRWALLGLPVGALLGLPAALIAAAWWAPPTPIVLAAGAAHTAGGYAGALGWLGATGLVASLAARRGLWAGAGTWSMTLYVTQSLVFTVLFTPWALGRTPTVAGSPLLAAALVAVAVWLVTVPVAGVLAARGVRGPLERAVRAVS